MVAVCDTSFLFSLFGNDAHSPRALDWLANYRRALYVTRFSDFEFANALRFAQFRGLLSEAEVLNHQQAYKLAMSEGRVRMENLNLASVIAEAELLSAKYTPQHGHRSFDIFHVASAKLMGAEIFLSFDQNQQRLAENVDLELAF